MSIARMALSVSVLAISVGLCTASVWAAGPDPGINVTVTNPPSSPVPVSIQGTSTVTGNVSVTNTPNVNVVNQPSVRNADNPALQPVVVPFEGTVNSIAAGGNFFSFGTVYTVPAGKRLVIEYVDAEFVVSPASNTGKGSLEIGVSNASNFTRHAIGISSDVIPCTLTQACIMINKSMRTYVSAGATLSGQGIFFAQASGGFAFLQGTINGYLVNIP